MSLSITSTHLLNGWWLHHFPGHSVPMLDNPLSESVPNIQLKHHVVQLQPFPHLLPGRRHWPPPCFSGLVPGPHCLSSSEWHKAKCRISDVTSPVPGECSLSWSCWPHNCLYKSGCHWQRRSNPPPWQHSVGQEKRGIIPSAARPCLSLLVALIGVRHKGKCSNLVPLPRNLPLLRRPTPTQLHRLWGNPADLPDE